MNMDLQLKKDVFSARIAYTRFSEMKNIQAFLCSTNCRQKIAGERETEIHLSQQKKLYVLKTAVRK